MASGGDLVPAAGRARGPPGAVGTQPGDPPRCPAGTQPGDRPRCPAVPHSGTAIWWHHPRDRGPVTGRGLAPPGCMEEFQLTCLQGQQDRGDKHLPGHFVLPGRTGTEGHSCCGCHRALTPRQEDTGAARPPLTPPGGCVRASPGRPGALPEPCPGQDAPHTPQRLRKGETRDRLRSERSLGPSPLLLQIWGAHRGSDDPLLICADCRSGAKPQGFTSGARSVSPSSPSRTQGTSGPGPVPPSLLLSHTPALSPLSKFRLWKWAGSSLFIPAPGLCTAEHSLPREAMPGSGWAGRAGKPHSVPP